MRPADFRRAAALFLFVFGASCGAPQEAGGRAPDAAEAAPANPAEAKPPFSRETVIRLNAIVARSLEAIRAYDAAILDIRADVNAAMAEDAGDAAKASAAAALMQVGTLYEDAARALADMRAAVDALKASGEDYNEAILAGMIDFVEDVEREIGAEKDRLAALLGAQ